MDSPIDVRILTQPDELAAYYELRYIRLRKPWGQPATAPDADGESESTHLGAFDGYVLVGVARLLSIDDDTFQLRSMAVAESHARRGVGSAILRFAEAHTLEQGKSQIMMHARENAVAFYEHNGYKTVAKSHLLFGEIQHYRMQKVL